MTEDFSNNDLYSFFHYVLADVKDCGVDDVSITSSDDYKELNIRLTYNRWNGEQVSYNCTYTNNEHYWMTRYEYIDRIKAYINEYNKLSNNNMADPSTKVQAMFRAYDRCVRVCGVVGYY